MAYKHKLVQAMADLYNKHKDKMIESIGEAASKDFTMRAIWMGVKRQAPGYIQGRVTEALQALDENEEAVAEIQDKLMEVLDLKPQITEVDLTEEEEIHNELLDAAWESEEKADLAEMAEQSGEEETPPVASAEVVLEPAEEEDSAKGNIS